MAPFLGTTWHFHSVGGGSFHCPRCDRERDYSATAVRKKLALLGKPLLGLGAETTLVACDACGGVWDVDVTGLAPHTARAIPSEDERALEAVLIAMVYSDSRVRSVEKQVAREAARHFAHREPTPREPATLETPNRPSEAFDRLARLRGVLDDSAKRRILAAAYRVCAADRELHSQEARLIVQLGELLDLHPRDVREAMKEGRR